MELANYFPIWNKLTPAQQEMLTSSAESMSARAGTIIHNGSWTAWGCC